MRTQRLYTAGLVIALGIAGAAAKPEAGPTFTVIVHRANATVQVSPDELRDVLLGNRREWPNHRRITVVQGDARSALVVRMVRTVLNMSVSEYNRYLLDLDFRGKPPVPLKAMASDEAVCDFVSIAPGAIGFIPPDAAANPACGDKVRVVAVQR